MAYVIPRKAKPFIACLVLVRDGVKVGFERCLESIKMAGMIPVVLDDESTDDTYLMAKRYGAKYRYHSDKGNREHEIWQTSEHQLRRALTDFALTFNPQVMATLDADEWWMSPITTGQVAQSMLKHNLYDTVYFRTVNFWNDEKHVKVFPHDPNYARPRVWRVYPSENQEPCGGLICRQAPDHVDQKRVATQYNICVGHSGYISREVRFAKSKRYVQLGAGQWAREFAADRNVREWDESILRGLP